MADPNLTYKIYIDIGSWIVPVVGSGYVLSTNNIINKLEFEQYKENRVINRIKCNGGLIFKGDEYQSLKSLEPTTYEINIRIDEIYQGSTYEFFGKIELRGNFQDDIRKLTCKIITIDNYNIILEDPVLNYEAEFNVKDEIVSSWLDFDNGFPYEGRLKNMYSIRDIIEYIVSEIDNTITFDSSSYNAFDKTGNEDIKYLYFETCYDVSSDVIITSDNNRVLKVKLKDIFDFLADNYSIYWYISDSSVFQLIHIPDYIQANGIDFDVEFSNHIPKKEYQYLDNNITLIQRDIPDDNTSNNSFSGFDIKFPQLPKFIKKEIDYQYHTDLTAFIDTNEVVTSGTFIFSTEPTENDIDINFTNNRFLDGSFIPFSGFTTFSNPGTSLTIGDNVYSEPPIRGCHMELSDSLLPSGILNPGDIVKIDFNADSVPGSPGIFINIYAYDGIATVSLSDDIISTTGAHSIQATIDKEYDEVWFEVWRPSTNIFTATLSNIVATRFLFRVRNDLGLLNGGVSIGNVDEKYFANATEKSGLVNDFERTDLFKINDKKLVQIQIPIRNNFNDLDFAANHIAFNENVELINHKRTFQKSFDILEFLINENPPT